MIGDFPHDVVPFSHEITLQRNREELSECHTVRLILYNASGTGFVLFAWVNVLYTKSLIISKLAGISIGISSNNECIYWGVQWFVTVTVILSFKWHQDGKKLQLLLYFSAGGWFPNWTSIVCNTWMSLQFFFPQVINMSWSETNPI